MATKSSIHIKPCNIASSEAHNRRTAEYMRHIGESRIYVVPELSTDNEQWINPDFGSRGRSRRRGKRREHDGKRQLEPEYEKRQNKNKDRGQNGFEDRDPDDLHTAFFQNGELEELAC